MKKELIVLSLVIGGLLLGFIIRGLDETLAIVTYVIESDKISQPVKIAVIADLHSCDYGENQKILVDSIREEKPDLIVMVGDILDEKLAEDNAMIFMEQIGEAYPCYYVSGNHEYWGGQVEAIKLQIEDYNIQVLEGDHVTLDLAGTRIGISGIDDPKVGREIWDSQLEAAAEGIDTMQYNLLLSHRPEKFEVYNAYGFDLVISGHAHGGQWRLPGLINGLFAPNQGLFPAYAGGVYTGGDQQMIVSRGLAKESTRVPRFYNRPELVMITLN